MTRGRTLWLVVFFALLTPSTGRAQETLRSIRWEELQAGQRLAGDLVDSAAADGPVLRLAHDDPGPVTFELVTIDDPPITATRYALRGRVRYEDVAAGSYLEMWSHLPEGAFFSRTLGDGGPMGRLDGSSGWRDFLLPFTNREGGAPPHRLVVNLVLTGSGTVEVSPLELVQFDEGALTGDAAAWWSPTQAGLLGAILGSTLGALLGWLASTGRARGFVLATLGAMAWVGLGFVLLGAWAAVSRQPYAVFYPLLLVGAISSVLGFSLPRTIARRYEDMELQRMRALDAR